MFVMLFRLAFSPTEIDRRGLTIYRNGGEKTEAGAQPLPDSHLQGNEKARSEYNNVSKERFFFASFG